MLACSVIPSIPAIPGTGAQPTPLAALWPDVPAMDGMTLSTTIQPSPFVKVLLGIVAKQVLGSSQDLGDWVDFTSAKTPDDLRAFYTSDLMVANGWDKSDSPNCYNGAEQGVSQVGAVCFFTKQVNNETTGLIILATQDDATKPTNIFFVRVQLPEPTPTPAP
jgi:hypothetical protein